MNPRSTVDCPHCGGAVEIPELPTPHSPPARARLLGGPLNGKPYAIGPGAPPPWIRVEECRHGRYEVYGGDKPDPGWAKAYHWRQERSCSCLHTAPRQVPGSRRPSVDVRTEEQRLEDRVRFGVCQSCGSAWRTYSDVRDGAVVLIVDCPSCGEVGPVHPSAPAAPRSAPLPATRARLLGGPRDGQEWPVDGAAPATIAVPECSAGRYEVYGGDKPEPGWAKAYHWRQEKPCGHRHANPRRAGIGRPAFDARNRAEQLDDVTRYGRCPTCTSALRTFSDERDGAVVLIVDCPSCGEVEKGGG